MEIDKKELAIAAAKAILGRVPYIGTALTEAAFDYNSRIKQKRFEQFVHSLSQDVEKLKESAKNHDYFKSEEFVDFFESVLRRVLRTRSEEKRQRLRKILLRQICEAKQLDFEETFLDILLSIHEKQIEILEGHCKYAGIVRQQEFIRQIRNEHRDPVSRKERLEVAEFRQAAYYGIAEEIYKFYVLDLISKALLYDNGMGRMDTRALEILEITELGKRFLDFIKINAE